MEMQATPATRMAGITLIVSAPLTLIGIVLMPGSAVVEPADPMDIARVVDAISDNARLQHVSSLLAILSGTLALFALFTLWRVVGDSSWGDGLVRAGILPLALFFAAMILLQGVNHMIAHLAAHGEGTGIPEASVHSMAWTLQAVRVGFFIAASWVSALGLTALGLGMFLRLRSEPGGALKVVSLALAAAAGAAVIMLLIADHVHTLSMLYKLALLHSLAATVWYVMVGMALCKGSHGLAPGQ